MIRSKLGRARRDRTALPKAVHGHTAGSSRWCRTACRASVDDSGDATQRAAPGDGKLEKVGWALPNAGVDCDWRDFRAQLVAREAAPDGAPTPSTSTAATWAHLLPGPEPACVLLANPMLFSNDQRHFNKAVILVTDHGAAGSRGIILNRVSPVKLKDLKSVDYESAGFEIFRECCISIGGDVSEMGLTMLHQLPVPAAREVRRGLFLGGGAAVAEHVAAGHAEPTSVRWFYKYAGWGPGQLEREIARRVWFPVSCSTDLLTSDVEGAGHGMWHALMEAVGDDFRRVSLEVKAGAQR